MKLVGGTPGEVGAGGWAYEDARQVAGERGGVRLVGEAGAAGPTLRMERTYFQRTEF